MRWSGDREKERAARAARLRIHVALLLWATILLAVASSRSGAALARLTNRSPVPAASAGLSP